MFFVLKFELILIIGSNNVLTEGARKVYRGRRVGQGWYIGLGKLKKEAKAQQKGLQSLIKEVSLSSCVFVDLPPRLHSTQRCDN
jgi:hypothetical protein